MWVISQSPMQIPGAAQLSRAMGEAILNTPVLRRQLFRMGGLVVKRMHCALNLGLLTTLRGQLVYLRNLNALRRGRYVSQSIAVREGRSARRAHDRVL